MKFSLATIYVKDMDKSLYFYNELLQLPLIGRHKMGPNAELAFLGIEGDANLELIANGKDNEYKGFSIGFTVENLDETLKLLEENGHPLIKEINPSPDMRLCFVNGPDGEEVELM